jgi:hypothetical protein
MQRVVHFLAIYFCSRIGFSQTKTDNFPSIKLIGQFEIPFNKSFKNTTVGGLSGIDYDTKNNTYCLISDDRSAKNDARFYSAKIHFTKNGLDSVELIDVKFLLQPNGDRYPSVKQNANLTPDPESIRYNIVTNELAWSSEGERTINASDTILQNPTIQLMDRDGKFMSAFKIPSNLIMQTSSIGPRQNGTLEGISFNEDQSSLYACLEEPLFQDGPKADVIATKSYVRIFKFDTESKTNSAQFAYPLEKVAFEANPPTAFKVNGVSEILWYSDNKLITIERSFSTGRLPCTVKVFITDLALADDVSAIYSLTENPPKNLATKQLLKNMDDLGIFIDNIEGVTFGPTLPNGHKTLVFVADNNFQFFEKNQFLVFEVLP